MELVVRGKMPGGKDTKTESGGEEGSEGGNVRDKEDPEEQIKRTNNKITKCFYHENTNCINQNCEYRH